MKQVLVVITFALILAGVFIVYKAVIFLGERPSDSADVVLFEVEPHRSMKSLAHDLEKKNLVLDAEKFALYARLTGQANKVRVGEYALRRDMKPKDLMQVLISGKSIEHVVTVTEGLNKFEIADAVEKLHIASRSEFLHLCTDRSLAKELLGEELPSLEGYLYPETYHVTKYTGAKGLIKIMVQRFLEVFQELSPHLTGSLNRHQLVTLASIVEKETGAPEERSLVSSVFYNRLRLKMRLQTDPTVIYGIWDKSGSYNGNISTMDLQTPTAYNTYTLPGLPYGPIGNPGRDALAATLHPASTEFLFFVSRNNGTHTFTRTYAEHQRAVGKFQLDRKAREGHSWRELQPKKMKRAEH